MLLPIWDVWFAVMYWIWSFFLVSLDAAFGLEADAESTVRVVFVSAGWYAPKNHILSLTIGPPMAKPGSMRLYLSFGYVTYSATSELPSAVRSVGVLLPSSRSPSQLNSAAPW